ncbi:MFS transporter [Paraburkholderia youngii]|uniref:MFS transporter n=1 Tax=Paraburkholderia youngii TaxID=2782701 RepID=UPI003D1BB65E
MEQVSVSDNGIESGSRAHTDLDNDALYGTVVRRLAPILIICYTIACLDRVNIGYAKLQMLDDLRLSDSAYAFGASVFFWGYLLFQVPSNIFLHRVGARVWISRIMFAWGCVAVAMMFIAEIATFVGIKNATVFYLLRFLLGVCESGFYPGVVLYVNYWFPPHRQSKMLAGFILALPLSLVVGGPLSGWLMDSTHGWMSLDGWQWMLGIEGVPALAMAIYVRCRLPKGIDDARWLNEEEKGTLKRGLENKIAKKSRNLRAAVKDYRVLLLASIMLTFNTGFYGLSFWLPSIMKAAGVHSTFAIGVLSAIPFVIAAIAMVLNASHSERTGERRWHAAIPAFIGAVGLALSAAFGNNIALSVMFLCVAASGLLGMMPVFWTFPGRYLSGTAAAAGIALISSLGSFSGIAGSFITSVTKSVTGNINDGTYVLAACLLVSAVLILFLPEDEAQR